jgi:hypothetical protein
LRGGLQIGPAVELFPQEVYGAPLLDAYQLEAKIAKYPRTAVSPDLLGYLTNLEALPADTQFNVYAAQKVILASMLMLTRFSLDRSSSTCGISQYTTGTIPIAMTLLCCIARGSLSIRPIPVTSCLRRERVRRSSAGCFQVRPGSARKRAGRQYYRIEDSSCGVIA